VSASLMDVAPSIFKRVQPEPNTGCWLWTGRIDRKGYARLERGSWPNKKAHRVTRFLWSHFYGPIPDGLVLDHLCRTLCCINPDHLEPVTIRENVRRAYAFRRANGLPLGGATNRGKRGPRIHKRCARGGRFVLVCNGCGQTT
jgi:hypothetical protein